MDVEVETEILGPTVNMEQIWDEVKIALNDEQPFDLSGQMGPYIPYYTDIVEEQLCEQNHHKYDLEYSGPESWLVSCCPHKQESTDRIKVNFDFNLGVHRAVMYTHSHAPLSCITCDNGHCGCGADWILDSGASHHYTRNIEDFSSYEQIESAEQHAVQMASQDVMI
jgi:hypothetical protein